MKSVIFLAGSFLLTGSLYAQNYPDPEFQNEVYALEKGASLKLVKLEKGSAAMESKTKAAGFGGTESGYTLDGNKSGVRVPSGTQVTFVIASGNSGSHTDVHNDSVMKANGVDPSLLQSMNGMFDPVNMLTLYKMDPGNNSRKIIIQKSGPSLPFAKKKIKPTEKINFSVKKIKDGYWEMVTDKPLEKGEYAFTMLDVMKASSMGTMTLFTFGVD